MYVWSNYQGTALLKDTGCHICLSEVCCGPSSSPLSTDDADADVITSSQHPWHSCAAIFPTFIPTEGRIDGAPILLFIHSSLPLLFPTLLSLTHRCAQHLAHPAPPLLRLRHTPFPRRIVHVWMRCGKWCCRLTKIREKIRAADWYSRRRHQSILAPFWMQEIHLVRVSSLNFWGKTSLPWYVCHGTEAALVCASLRWFVCADYLKAFVRMRDAASGCLGYDSAVTNSCF